jgi:magnesium-transporting ATPase (P-type)
MLISLIQCFLPWILYFILVGPTQHQLDLAIWVAAFTSIAFEIRNLKRGYLLSWATLVFFIFLIIAVVIFRSGFVTKYEWVFSNGALAAIALFSIFIRKPFTIQYAKEEVEEKYWDSPIFIKINYILTAVWCLSFFISLGLNILKFYIPNFNGWGYQVSTYLPTIAAIWFTGWFPDWYKNRV